LAEVPGIFEALSLTISFYRCKFILNLSAIINTRKHVIVFVIEAIYDLYFSFLWKTVLIFPLIKCKTVTDLEFTSSISKEFYGFFGSLIS
jgi:hypothetical protein